MADRAIWITEGNKEVRGVIASLLGGLMASPDEPTPFYVHSPWLSDFHLFDNRLGQLEGLFEMAPGLLGKPSVLFSQVLAALSDRIPVRIVTIRDPHSLAFVERVRQWAPKDVSVLFAPDTDHEKGMLCRHFYVEGSMNFTYYGVYCREEKLNVHVSATPEGDRTIARALLQFESRWDSLKERA